MKREEFIQTYDGTVFHYDESDSAANTFTLEGIAISLSRQPRFLGHSTVKFTVGQHTLYGAALLHQDAKEHNWSDLTVARLSLLWYLHDMHEAFTGDIPAPLKTYLKERLGFDLNLITDDIDQVIFETLEVELPTKVEANYIHDLDLHCLYVERKVLMPSNLRWSIDEHELPPHYNADLTPFLRMSESDVATILHYETARLIGKAKEFGGSHVI